jgi:hypothetical protein
MFTAVTKPDPVRPTPGEAFCGRQVEVVDLAKCSWSPLLPLMAIVQDAIDTDTVVVTMTREIVDLDLKARRTTQNRVGVSHAHGRSPGLEECTDNKSGNWTIKDVLQILCAYVFDRTLQPDSF